LTSEFDLDAYLARIGYAGPVAPDLATLSALHARQVDAIPFENLDVLMGRGVRLDLESLQAKLVGARRGGYCYELNSLFKAALEAIGFQVTGLAGRVRWMAPPDRPMGARTHMALRVDLPEGPYLADVGFGGHLLDHPIRFEPDLEQTTPQARLKLTREGSDLMLWTLIGEGWRTIYLLGLEPQLPADYAVGNWFTSTHPEVIFASSLMMERLTPDERISLFNTRLTERPRSGEARQRVIESGADLGEVLQALFGLDAPDPSDAVFEHLPKA
jgi:N-hydroxyarylamine O-acetyltransferase